VIDVLARAVRVQFCGSQENTLKECVQMKRSVARVGIVMLVALLLVGVVATAVLAQDSTKRVGLVVRYGDGSEHLEIVTASTDATGEGILNASSLDVEIMQSAWGPGLCRIEGDGCPADDCFCATEFWSFWTLNAVGPAWEAAAVGIGGVTPANGDVLGFSWTASDENWNPINEPPVYTFSQIEAATEAPTDIPEPATMLLLGGGLMSLAGYVGLRRRAR
jgi:hypothetical protein